MAERSVHMVWTSPPYWGLRAYGTEPQAWSTGWLGEHGLEPSLDLWLEHEALIWRAVRRVLRDDGVIFINIGDAYASSPNGRSAADTKAAGNDDRTFRDRPFGTVGGGFKPKDRLMMPARLAIALQADGWFLRDEIVWHKRNPMPSSVKDRTTPAHEMLYMLSKKARYFYDAVAIAEPIEESSHARYDQETLNDQKGGFKQDAYENNGLVGQRARSRRPAEILKSLASGNRTRNKRSVWPLASEAFKGAHFATAPTNLVEPCILAGTSAVGVCRRCGAPWRRLTTSRAHLQDDASEAKGVRGAGGQKPMDASNGWQGFPRGTTERHTTGWAPSCRCDAGKPVPAVVLDIFGGAGTTGLVADRLGRDAVLIELLPGYAEMARYRIGLNAAIVERDEAADKVS